MTRNSNLAISFSDEQAMILDSAREFCRDKSDISAVRSLLRSETGFDAEVWEQIVALGWTGIAIPESFGGSELGLGSIVPLAESMGRHLLATPFISTSIAAQAILRAGSAEQQAKWLPAIVNGSIGSMALLDNEDWGATISTCTLDVVTSGSGELRLGGAKQLVTDAGQADFFIASARFDQRPVLVIVEANQLPDGAISKKMLIDETKRAAKVDFTGVTISSAAVMPNPLALNDIKLIGALLTAAESTGTCAATLDCIVAYLTSRIQFGRLIGAYQSLKHPTVEILMQMDSARSFIYHAATLIDQSSIESVINSDTEIACRMAKTQATEALLFAGDRAIQFHGGMGFTYDCDAQLYLRRAQWAQHQYGDAQHHRLHLARLLLD